jgi:metal-sulfur cluster biosynthetic enzyme
VDKPEAGRDRPKEDAVAESGINRGAVLEALKDVLDPELGMNIVDLGLVYRVEVGDEKVEIDFTLTYPGCPAGEHIQDDMKMTVQASTGVENVEINLVWDPPWRPDFMTEEARVSLGYPI